MLLHERLENRVRQHFLMFFGVNYYDFNVSASVYEESLITRPRRFGKTLNMSMVEQFFFVDYAKRSELFKGHRLRIKMLEQRGCISLSGFCSNSGDPGTYSFFVLKRDKL